MRILLIDDSRAMRKIQRDVIMELGFRDIVEAENGAEAIKVMAAMNFQIDLIMTDWNMPVMDGITFVREMKKRPNLAGLPIIMVTSEADRPQIDQALKLGVDGYILKPFTSDLLRRTIKAIKEGVELADAPVTEQLSRSQNIGRAEEALFSQLSSSVEAKIKELADVKFYQASQKIVSAGTIMDEFHFVLFGEIRAVTPDGVPTGDVYKQGDCYAEMSLLTGDPLPVSYIAGTVSTIGAIPGTDFMTVLMTHPEFSAKLTKHLAARASRPRPDSSAVRSLHEDSSVWQGSLQIISLPELMQTLSMGKKTGILHLDGNSGAGAIALDHGAAVYAEFGQLTGEEAFVQLMLSELTDFRLTVDETAGEKNIFTDTTALILDALRRKDESAANRRINPNV